ncbi:MAG: hypothetical protein HY608_05700 [Planctomycetes bacterium]|nr:hypothetical protein [Planctomycetota bacterium]
MKRKTRLECDNADLIVRILRRIDSEQAPERARRIATILASRTRVVQESSKVRQAGER